MTLKKILLSNYSPCLCSHCSDKGVSVSLDRISPDHLIVSGKQYQRIYTYAGNLCDFFVLDRVSQNPVQVGIIDMKGGTLDEKDFITAFKQLKNGASVVNSIIGVINVNRFIPRIAIRRGVNSFVSRMMANDKYKITFRTFSENIKTIHHGQSLSF